MIRAKVIGEVWATRKAPGLAGRKLLLLAPDGSEQLLVGVDTLDASAGQSVLLSWGSGGRNALQVGPDNREILCDAAVSMVVDGSIDD